MVTTIIKNIPYFLEIRVTDVKGASVEGLIIEFQIIKVLDNQIVISGVMTDISQGVYCTNITLTTVGQYRVLYDLEEYYVDSIETLIVEESIFDRMNIIFNKLVFIENALEIKQPPHYVSNDNDTCLYKRDPDTFQVQYNKLLANGWLLIKIEGNIYYFKK